MVDKKAIGKKAQGQKKYQRGSREENGDGVRRHARKPKENKEQEIENQEEQNLDFVYGFHSALEVLNASNRDVNKVFMQEGLAANKAQALQAAAKNHGGQVSIVPKSKLDLLSDGGNHQGVVVAVAAYQYAEVEDILGVAAERGEDPFIIILDGIEDPHNLGSILRTADAAGVHGVIIQNRRAVGLTQIVAKTSTGAIEHVPVARVTNISQTIEKLKAQNIWVFGTDMEGDNLWGMDATMPIAIVIGNEGKGISPGVKKHLDGVLSIPMRGHVQSLNASVAAALMIYQVYKSRMDGHIDSPKP